MRGSIAWIVGVCVLLAPACHGAGTLQAPAGGAIFGATGNAGDRPEIGPDTARDGLGPAADTGTVTAPGIVAVTDPKADSVPGNQGAGTLQISIRWPDRGDPGFKTQLIPLSTDRAEITIFAGATTAGATASEVALERPAGSSAATASATTQLKVGTYTAIAKAYRSDGGNRVEVAKANATSFAVVRGARVPLTLKLGPLLAPTITELSPNLGQAGEIVTLTGENLGVTLGKNPIVVFGGATASTVVPVSATSLRAVVPAGVKVGNVGVVNDGVPSTSTATFWSVAGVEIGALKASWDPTDTDTRAVLVGTTLDFDATTSFAVQSGESLGLYGTPPAVAFSTSDAAKGTIDATTGVFTAGSTGTTTITAKLGPKTATLKAETDDVTVVLSAPPTSMGGSGELSHAFTAYNRLTNGATNSLVTWASSDPASISVSSTGLAAAVDFARRGTVTVSATSQLLVRVATASVNLRNYSVSTFAGTTTPGTADGATSSAGFSMPLGVAVDKTETVLVADTRTPYNNNRIRVITPEGVVSSLASGVVDRCGNYYPHARGITTDAAGRVHITTWVIQDAGNTPLPDSYAHWVMATNPERTSWVRVAGITVYPDLPNCNGTMGGAFREGDLLTATLFNRPIGLAVDGGGNYYVADSQNFRIRKLSGGTSSTLAGGSQAGFSDGATASATFNQPTGLGLGSDGNLYVADLLNHAIRKVTTSGTVTTVTGDGTPGSADGTLSEARFNQPWGIALAPDGSIFVTDKANHRIRKITPAGRVVTVAGTGSGYADGVGTAALLKSPTGIGVDSFGNVYVADTGNYCIRKLAP